MNDERPALTGEELQAIADVCLCEPAGWVPRPVNLPLAERLVKRGTLVRKMVKGEAVYFASDEFKAAAALQAAIGELSVN
jgi:hypothetical protein